MGSAKSKYRPGQRVWYVTECSTNSPHMGRWNNTLFRHASLKWNHGKSSFKVAPAVIINNFKYPKHGGQAACRRTTSALNYNPDYHDIGYEIAPDFFNNTLDIEEGPEYEGVVLLTSFSVLEDELYLSADDAIAAIYKNLGNRQLLKEQYTRYEEYL